MKTGEVLPPVELEVSQEWLGCYYQAVGSNQSTTGAHAVSPAAIAGKALMMLLEPLNLPCGIVHTQAIIESHLPACIGDRLCCEGIITNMVKRLGIQIMTVVITVNSLDSQEILKAEMTFKLPGSQVVEG